MASSNDSDDDFVSSKSTTSRKEASNSFLTLLNSNNKFNEMLKNKIKQTETSPIISNNSFNPAASSTQIGTPNELKQKKSSKLLMSHHEKKKQNSFVTKPSVSYLQAERGNKKNNSSESSDSSSSPPSRSKRDSGTIPNKMPKIQFAKFNVMESSSSNHKKHKSKKSQAEDDSMPQIKLEIASDSESIERLKKKHRKQSSSESSSRSTRHDNVSQNEIEGASYEFQKTSKKKKRKKDKSNSYILNTETKDDDNRTSQANKKASDRLRKFETEDSLDIISTRLNSFNKMKSKELIYIVQIPVKLDPNRLIGADISLNDSVRVIKKYDSVVSYDGQEPITICDNSENLKIVQPVGSIKLHRRLSSKKIIDVPNVLNKSVVFPTNLKSRHPLFGSNFENKIALEEHVKTKLESVRDSPVKKKKKKKHKEDRTEHHEEEIFKFLSQGPEEREHVSKKKKKRRGEEFEEHESSHKKKKYEVAKEKQKQSDDSGDTLIHEMLLSKIATLDMNKKNKKKKG